MQNVIVAKFRKGTFRLERYKTLSDSLTLNAGDSWAFVGANGAGKSGAACALAGELPLLTGERQCRFTRITRLSFEQLQKLVSDEWQRNNTGYAQSSRRRYRHYREIIQMKVHHPAPLCDAGAAVWYFRFTNRRFKYLLPARREKRRCVRRWMSEPELT